MTCKHCQEQLLHYLYDVLDPDERAAIAQHLDECVACQAVRDALVAQQELLAEAAKESFAEVTFQPPTGTPKRFGEPTQILPRRQRGFSWVRVAVAACIAIFVLGGGTMGVMGWFRTKDEIQVAEAKLDKAKKDADRYQQSLEQHKVQTKEEIKAIQEQIDKLFEQWSRDAKKLTETQKNKLALEVEAPKSQPAGGQIPVQVNVPNLHASAATAKSMAAPAPKSTGAAAKDKTADGTRGQITVWDKGNKKPLYQVELQNLQMNNSINLPPQPFMAGNEYAIKVDVLGPDGKLLAREETSLTTPEYLTHLYTDRPMYRPGEFVHFRSLTVERFSLKPAQEDLQLVYRIVGPNQQEIFKVEGAATLVSEPASKEPIKGPDGKALRGLGAGDCYLSPDLPGGQYTMIVSEAQNRFPPEKRSFLVSQWQMPRMNKELKFHRSSYGPGETVEVHAFAKRAEGGAPAANQRADIQAIVDGNISYKNTLQTGRDGKLPTIIFPLPPAAAMPRGQGSISIAFYDGAGPEPIVRPIPIVLNKLHVEFFPEGGELTQGVSNRVYFQVKNTLGNPAELKGRIVDQDGNTAATLETLHDDLEDGINQGQGSFTMVPAAGKKYQLKIDTPIGMECKDPFPAVKADGVVLHLTKPVAHDAIEGEVTSTDRRRLLMVGAYCRGRLLEQERVVAFPGKTIQFTLRTDPSVGGVYRVTVHEIVPTDGDPQFVPRAERLTYRKGEQRLTAALDGVKEAYFPGEHVQFKVKTQNEQKAKAPAVALVSVVDLSLIKLADDKTDRSMPTHFLLTSEIRKPEDFENADVLLGNHPKAETALDLLLGTQGWRRFAEQDPKQFQEKHWADNPRVMAAWVAPNNRRNTVEQVVSEKVDKLYAVQAITMLDQLAKKEAVEIEPADAEQQRNLLQGNADAANFALSAARSNLSDYETRMYRYLMGSVIIGALIFGLAAIGLGVRRLGQGRSALAALVTGTALLLFLFMGSLAGVFYMIGSKEDPAQMFAARKNMVGEAEMKMQAVAPAPPPAPAIAPVARDVKGAEAGAAPGGAIPPLPGPAFGGMEKADVAKGDAKQIEVRAQANADRLAQNLKFEARAMAPPQMAMKRNMGAAPAAPIGPNANVGAALAKGQMQGGFAGGGNNAAMGGAGAGMPGGFGNFQPDAQFQMRQAPFGGGGGFNPAAERVLRQEGNYKEILRMRTGRAIELPPESPPFYVREYAHQNLQNVERDNTKNLDTVRRDFTETVGWFPALVLPGGEAMIAFDLSDAVTRYQVTVFSHSLDGRLGADRFEIASRLPFSIDPKTPFEISNTDKIVLPVAVKNDTKEEGRVELSVRASGLKTQDPQTRDVQIGANERNRGYFNYEPSLVQGDATIRVKGTFNTYGAQAQNNAVQNNVTANFQGGTDTVERSFKIVPDGFPIRGSVSGLLEQSAAHDITLPKDWLPGTLQCQVQVFPSTLAQLQKGLEGLLREPCGCFEQSSSSNYPNVLILNYLQEAGQGDPNIEKRARGLLQNGYQRLTSFECTDPKEQTTRRGYEWFGQTAPPHEALTAYGLLQFRDMAKVYAVDKDMVERTRQYLLAQRDGQGGFKRNARALDSFGRAPEHITSAYIVWALSDAGVDDDLSKELAALAAKVKDSKDPYFTALVALGHLNRGKTEDALAFAKRLKESQKDDGHLEGTETSITGSQGRDLHLETTALAVLAWLKANRPDEFHGNVEKAVKWINGQRSGQGSFGATQSTILALKALIAHTRDAKKIAEDGKLTVTLPQAKSAAAAETSFTAGASEPITLTLSEGKGLQPGKNKVVVGITGKNVFPYTVSWSYQTLTPPSDAGCPVKLATKLSKDNAQEGETVKLFATVQNATDKGHGMAVAILGLPAGLTIPEDAKQLKEMAKLRDNGTKPGAISSWELKGRELILYWRDLAPKQKIDVELDLICRLPGTYRGPASRAYLYYNADHKDWIEPLAIAIEPQRAE
jgi:uncharacterized membrane-anchored protein YhcB (DUF1043 family)